MQGVINGAVGRSFLDLDATARKMIEAAVAVTTGQLGLSTPADTLKLLKQGDARAVTPFRRELARQIAGAVVMLDEHVDAVFEEQPPMRQLVSTPAIAVPFRIWIVARLCSANLYVQLEDLSGALHRAYSVLGHPECSPMVETHIVDSRDYHLRNGKHPDKADMHLLASRDHPD